MPLYEYKCEKCGDVFEVLQKFSDAPLKVHQNCGGTVERLLSPPAFQFKGSGWYITDYKKSNGSSPSHGSTNGHDSGSNGNAKNGTDTSKSASSEKSTSSSTTPAASTK